MCRCLAMSLVRQFFQFDISEAAATLSQIVDEGWFMPGMSILLAPLTLITDPVLCKEIQNIQILADDPSKVPSVCVQDPFPAHFVLIARFYLGVLNFAAVATILRYLQKAFGPRGPLIYMLCGLALPYYWMFSFMIWGDLIAAHLLLCLLLFVFDRIGSPMKANSHGLGSAVWIGAALGGITYLRGFYYMFAPLFAALFFLGLPPHRPLRVRIGIAALRSSGFVLALAVVLAPWTAAVTWHHGFHLTTTSTPPSRIILLGNSDKVRIAANIRRFFFEDDFPYRFARISEPSVGYPPREWRRSAFDILICVNYWGWRALLAIGTILLLTPIAFNTSNLFLSTIFKYVVVLYSTHPFMVLAHSRYYVEYLPFIAAALAAVATARRFPFPSGPPTDAAEYAVLLGQGIVWLIAFTVAVAFLAAAGPFGHV
jgi:hypothetical protein